MKREFDFRVTHVDESTSKVNFGDRFTVAKFVAGDRNFEP